MFPYEYVGLTWEEAQKRTEPPVIYHYTDAEVLKEELTGEYTQWGICFKTSSFSPFVISTAAQSSSGGGYYYGGASTPGISAVKTADAAKSATDYTSGIYGLTFRSTAAFSGFWACRAPHSARRRRQQEVYNMNNETKRANTPCMTWCAFLVLCCGHYAAAGADTGLGMIKTPVWRSRC